MGVTQVRRLHRGWKTIPHLHRRGISILALLVLVVMIWPTEDQGLEAAVYLPPELSHLDALNGGFLPGNFTDERLRERLRGEGMSAVQVDSTPYDVETYEISSGDSLSGIFDRMGLGQTVMYQILSADESLLALDVLRAGHRLKFYKHPDTGRLERMQLYVHAGYQVSYERFDDDSFEYEETLIEGDWPQRVIGGEINGSFYVSARNAGLSDREVAEITRLLEDSIDFRRQIRAGDTFDVVRAEQMINGRATGRTRIEAIRIHGHTKRSAFLFEDGNYYDEKGESLQRAFMRYPSNQRYRISSGFNPSRRHPVTGRVTPHNGTDFAMSTGTPVLTTGDGVVTRVENHPFAGKYVEIQHGSRYTTRYMHLNRILVRHGQTVNRGDRIGLSGATGRVTGPHLHFELHINGRPVDPMRAEIPMAESVPDDQREAFEKRVEELLLVVENSNVQYARQ